MMPLLVACLTIFCALPSYAQVTTGGLKIVVTDDSEFELPIAEAAVTLTGSSLIGGQQERLTDANGEVQFVQLLPGTYDASVTRSGFAGVTLRGVEIKVNRTSVQYVSMPLEGSAEEVEVVAKKDVVDTSSTSRGTVLTKEFFDWIPVG
jgi:hypothetical protein